MVALIFSALQNHIFSINLGFYTILNHISLTFSALPVKLAGVVSELMMDVGENIPKTYISGTEGLQWLVTPRCG
jgi:hypothetical protein